MGGDLQDSALGYECHVPFADDLGVVVLAGELNLSFKDEDHEVVREMRLHYGFSTVKGQVAHACDMVVFIINQFCAVFVGYETVILHF